MIWTAFLALAPPQMFPVRLSNSPFIVTRARAKGPSFRAYIEVRGIDLDRFDSLVWSGRHGSTACHCMSLRVIACHLRVTARVVAWHLDIRGGHMKTRKVHIFKRGHFPVHVTCVSLSGPLGTSDHFDHVSSQLGEPLDRGSCRTISRGHLVR